jgi:hypothetical protein
MLELKWQLIDSRWKSWVAIGSSSAHAQNNNVEGISLSNLAVVLKYTQ